MTESFTCDMCGGMFDKAQSDDEANKEALKLWGVAEASERHDMAVVCDDCWQQIMEWAKAKGEVQP